MATEERFVINELALRNLTGTTVFSEAVPAMENEFRFTTVRAVTTSSTVTTSPRPVSPLQSIFDDLDRLELRSNYRFKPSKHAVRSAALYILQTYARMGSMFPRPSFVLDGEKGIVIKWERNGHSVRLNCFADPRDADYIYFENDEYDTEDNVTPEVLHNRLNWLLQHEREPAR